MSAKLQPGYIMLTDEINAAELAEDVKVQEIAELKAIIADKKTELGKLQTSLAGWQQALSGSDPAHAQIKVNERLQGIAAINKEIADLEKSLTAAGNALKSIQNQITSLYAQRDAFENAYKNSIMNGKSPEDAEATANAAANQIKAEQETKWYNNPLAWIGIVAALALIGFIAYKLIKK